MPESEMGAEKEALLSSLTVQRNHVIGILEGLDEDALRRPVLPSGWSCLGLVRHLALDVERFWFRGTVAGEQSVIDALSEDQEDAWQVGSEVPAAEIFASYRQEVELANAIISATPVNSAPTWWPDFFGDFRMDSLRQVILHVITETACHAGHLDAARELIDGKRWMVLTE